MSTQDKAPMRRIVCAALLSQNGHVILGPRHFDERMHKQIEAGAKAGMWPENEFLDSHQGFIDQFGTFFDREDSWLIATQANQILRHPVSNGKLYSEHLY